MVAHQQLIECPVMAPKRRLPQHGDPVAIGGIADTTRKSKMYSD